MRIRAVVVGVASIVLVAGAVLGGLAAYGMSRAPDGAEPLEATRVALHPGVDYAVLEVEGMA